MPMESHLVEYVEYELILMKFAYRCTNVLLGFVIHHLPTQIGRAHV